MALWARVEARRRTGSLGFRAGGVKPARSAAAKSAVTREWANQNKRMYKIIGADGVQYGPITVEQLRQWIGEGRVNAQTLTQPEGGTDWKPLSAYPELAPLATPVTPPLSLEPGIPPVQAVDAVRQVQGPAIGLLITAVLGLAGAVGTLGMHAFGIAIEPPGRHGGDPFQQLINFSAGGLGMIQGLVQLAVGGVILYGALKMMKLQNYQLAMVSTVMAMVPCVSPCCVVGLPIGIWALVVLIKPEVKSVFK